MRTSRKSSVLRLALPLLGIAAAAYGCGQDGKTPGTGGNSPTSTSRSSSSGVPSSNASSSSSGSSSSVGASSGAMSASSSSSSSNSGYVVAMVQSTKANATDITMDDVRTLVKDAVTKAGGLSFINDGQTVILKPNLLRTTEATGQLPAEVNGITTDWRVARVVAELVRERNPKGKILVMEGSTESTTQAFSRMGYTSANFGTYVDEFIALEGTSCNDKSSTGLTKKASASGKQYWVNQRYISADIVISLAVMKTHTQAGVTGTVKNLGIGATPASQYATTGCSRTQTAAYIDHSREGLAQFIHDFYSLRPADFVLVDGLQGVQHGPSPQWGGGNYANDKMNMRLILASKNAVAADTIEALVMGCDPKNVDYLVKLETSGFGTTDPSKIQVVGKQVSEVQKQFAGPDWACGTP